MLPVSAGAALLRRLLRGQLARRRPRHAARDAVDDLLRDGLEGLRDVDVGLGRRLDEAHVVLGGERLALLRRHLARALVVALVADEDLVDLRAGVSRGDGVKGDERRRRAPAGPRGP